MAKPQLSGRFGTNPAATEPFRTDYGSEGRGSNSQSSPSRPPGVRQRFALLAKPLRERRFWLFPTDVDAAWPVSGPRWGRETWQAARLRARMSSSRPRAATYGMRCDAMPNWPVSCIIRSC